MYTQLEAGNISKEDFEKYFQILKQLMLRQDADIRLLNEQFEKEKISILKTSTKERVA
jgi:hypothetical protein